MKEYATWRRLLGAWDLADRVRPAPAPLVGVGLVATDEVDRRARAHRCELHHIVSRQGPDRGRAALEDWLDHCASVLPFPFRGRFTVRLEDAVSLENLWSHGDDVVVGALTEHQAKVSVERVRRDLRSTRRQLFRQMAMSQRMTSASGELMHGSAALIWAQTGEGSSRQRAVTALERAAEGLGRGLVQAASKPKPAPSRDSAAALRTELISQSAWMRAQAEDASDADAQVLLMAARGLDPRDDATGEDLVRGRTEALAILKNAHPSAVLAQAGRRLSGNPEWRPSPLTPAQHRPRRRSDRGQAPLPERLAAVLGRLEDRGALVAPKVPDAVATLEDADAVLEAANSLWAGWWTADAADATVLDEGIQLLWADLEAYGGRIVVPEVGDHLDPNEHEAIDADDSGESTIVCVYSVGLVIGDRLLRPARVGTGRLEGEE